MSLHNRFASRERPAEIRRGLYDELNAIAGRTDTLLAEAGAKTRQYVVALDELTAAERLHGHASRAADADPYLDAIRRSVAKEAEAVGPAYREGSGTGVRYTAFDRHSKLTSQALREIEISRTQLAEWRNAARPLESTEQQIRRFRSVHDTGPWATVEQMLGRKLTDRPVIPNYASRVDESASSQEDLLRAFTELASAPSGRHYFALAPCMRCSAPRAPACPLPSPDTDETMTVRKDEFARRRRQLMLMIGKGGIAVLPTATEKQRNSDVHYNFRPDSDFHYLTGFDEPEAVAVLVPGRAPAEYILFVRDRDPTRETWDGARAGPEGGVEHYVADDAFPVADIDEILPAATEKQRNNATSTTTTAPTATSTT